MLITTTTTKTTTLPVDHNNHTAPFVIWIKLLQLQHNTTITTTLITTIITNTTISTHLFIEFCIQLFQRSIHFSGGVSFNYNFFWLTFNNTYK